MRTGIVVAVAVGVRMLGEWAGWYAHPQTAQAILPLIMMGASLLGSYLASHKAKNDAAKATKGATLQDILPQLQALMAQMNQHGQQGYSAQTRNYLRTDPGAASLFPGAQAPAGAVPLKDAIARMTYSLMPRSAQGQPPTAA